jgi:anti-sigma factor RsiW
MPGALRRTIFGSTCREVADFLSAYLDGELPDKERRAFRRHLFWCKDCVAYVDSYRKTVDLLRALGKDLPEEAPEPIPEALVAAVLAARNKAP